METVAVAVGQAVLDLHIDIADIHIFFLVGVIDSPKKAHL